MEPIKLIWYGRLPGLNEIINASRTCWQVGAKMKQEDMSELALVFKSQAKGKKFAEHVTAYIRFYEKDRRRDDDNVIGGGCKVVLDALTKAGIIIDDSPKYLHVIPERITLKGTAKEREKMARIEVDLVPEEFEGNIVYAVCDDAYCTISLWSRFDAARMAAEQLAAKRNKYFWVDKVVIDERDGAAHVPMFEVGEKPAWM